MRNKTELEEAERKGFHRGFDACWRMFDEHLTKVLQDRAGVWTEQAMRMVAARASQDRLQTLHRRNHPVREPVEGERPHEES